MKLDKISRILITSLRHKPEILNLSIDKMGWASVKDVLKSLDISSKDLDEIVSSNDKKRFEYNENKTKIRASQGHSIKNLEVYKEWSPYKPTSPLYHGTSRSAASIILKSELKPQSRTHVHLSKDLETAYKVGLRHDSNVVMLEIDAVQMYKDGFQFLESKNGVVLIKNVPSKYLRIIKYYKNNYD